MSNLTTPEAAATVCRAYEQLPSEIGRYVANGCVPVDPRRALRSFGHPGARFVRPDELKPLGDAARRLLDRFGAKHPGVAASLQGLDDFYFDIATCGTLMGEHFAPASMIAKEVARVEKNADSVDVLAAVGGALMWAHTHPDALGGQPNGTPDTNALHYLTSRAVMFTVSRPRNPETNALEAPSLFAVQYIGKHLLNYLGPLLALVGPLMDCEDDKARVPAVAYHPS